jgi:hypothetical protein
MSDNPSGEESLRQELEALGKNLVGALHSAWEAPESRRLREEMTSSLSDLAATLKREADALAHHPATQQVKNDVEQIGEKIKATEAQEAVRRELLGALRTVNTELQKVIDHWSAPMPPAEPPSEDAAPTTPAE